MMKVRGRHHGTSNFIMPVFIFFFMSVPLTVHAEPADPGMTEKERRIGHLFDHYMTESFMMLRDERTSGKISELVDRIVKVTEHPDATFRLRIINDHMPFVSSFPGYIYVSSGMLDILQSKAELAFLIAHAIAHVKGKDQYRAYVEAVRRERVARFTGHLIPLLVFSGVGAAALAGGAAVASSPAVEGIIVMESGIYTTTLFAQAITAHDMHWKKSIHNKLVPLMNLPDTKAGLSAMVLLIEIYSGYDREIELAADNLSIGYLKKAGYDTRTGVSVLRKLRTVRNDERIRGCLSHLVSAQPGLEMRMENAHAALENNK